MAGPSPIPLELVLGGRDLTEPRLAPDGTLVVFVQRWRSAAALTTVPVGGGCERMLAPPVDPAPGRGLGGGCVAWLPGSDGVVFVGVDGELYVQPLVGAGRRLTAFERACRAPDVAPDGTWVVCAIDEAEVWRIELSDGDAGAAARASRRLDDGGHEFCADPVVGPDGAVVSWQAWNPPAMPWDAAERVDVRLGPAGDVVDRQRWRPSDGAVQQPRFLPDGTPTCVHDGSGWLNVHVGGEGAPAETAEHAGPSWGMGQRSYASSPDGRSVAFDRNEAGFGRLCVLDRTTGAVTPLGRGVHGQLSWAGDRIVALRSGARTPTAVVAADPATGVWDTLAVGPAGSWPLDELPEPELAEVDRDGVRLPAHRFAAGRGRLLCWVHGGPTDQWRVDFRPRVSYWWSRGWDVLVVDPRGSTGHGRAHQQALHGGWGRFDVDDTAALVAHAHEQGWARPATTALIGGSSGGLTVLGVLADHPRLVAGGVTSYPVSDLAALSAATHRFEAHYTETLVGPGHDAARARAASPISRAGRITGPLLVFHGSDDPVVPVEQSRALVEAVRAGGGDVELVVYEGAGHGFRDPDHVRDEYARTERFLAALVDGA